MHRVLSDLRFAFRRAHRRPGFTTIAVLSLALGIGANTAIFSLIDGLLLRRMAMPHREQVVELYQHQPSFEFAPFSYPDYVALKAEYGRDFSLMSAAQFAAAPRDMGDHVETLFAELVNGDYFTLLGLRAEAGRLLGREDDVAPGAHPVVVLSDEYWRRAFAADPSVVGREIRLAGRAYTVVGVAPASYHGMFPGVAPALYVPIRMLNQVQPSTSDQFLDRGNHSLFLKVRAAPGVSIAQVRTIAAAFTAEQARAFPGNWPAGTMVSVVPESQVLANPMIDGIVVPAAAALLAVVALVLLVTCANLASFLLAQARDRQREIAIRTALGASRGSIVRQLLLESLLLAGVGGVAGLVVSRAALGALLRAKLPVPIPLSVDVTLDTRVIGFTALATMAAALLFGLLPALQVTRPNIVDAIKTENAGGGPARRLSMRGALVVGQLAVSMVLLVTAALFLRSLQAREHMDPGFGRSPAGLVWFMIPADRYGGARRQLLLDQVEERVRRISGVQDVGVVDNIMLNLLSQQGRTVNVPGVTPPKGQRGFDNVDCASADSGFFAAAGVRIMSGRAFDASDRPGAPRVAIVNEQMAKTFWPGRDPVGSTFTADTVTYRVVGVSRTTKVRTIGEAPRLFFFTAYGQETSTSAWLVARTRPGGDDAGTVVQMIAALHDIDPSLMIMQGRTMSAHIAAMMLPARLGAMAFGLFAALALALAVMGVYGVVSYAVGRRSREVGIRVALGAESSAVVRLLMREGMVLVGGGAVLGLALAFAVTRGIQSLLSGVTAADPLTFVVAPLVLVGAGVLAAFVPARRTARTDPARVLRGE